MQRNFNIGPNFVLSAKVQICNLMAFSEYLNFTSDHATQNVLHLSNLKNVIRIILHLCVSTCLGLHSLCYRRGEELKWFSPSVFIYLASVVPAIWVLELDAKRNEILCIYVDIGPLHLFKL